MADNDRAVCDGITRRGWAAGAAALAVGLAANAETLAQAAPSPLSQKPGNVVVERRGGILLIGIDRPEAQNRLDPPILIGLGKTLYELDHDDSLRVAVLYGVGRHFCIGADGPALVAAQASGQFPPKDPDYISAFGLRPPFRSKPLVVAVHGATKFGGHELFLASDIRVAATDTVFSQAEVLRGVFPAGGGTIRFTREAGWANAMRYVLTGDEWGAEEARRLGLAQEIVPPGRQLDRAIELAAKIAAAAPLGVRATLASARQGLAVEEATALGALQADFARLVLSEDAKEARRALQEGRQPVFHGM
jgi:enoyl-CoA hydratase